ncbi:MAG: phosphatidate cytidylyltransferase [Chloroflexota bacterium]|nr:phosphatidate cytidylyltransferase [Chloroflexota bacterium]
MPNKNMLGKRIASGLVIIALALGLILLGGWVFAFGVAAILAMAAWEFAGLFETGGYAPAKIILVGGTFLTALSAQFSDTLVSQATFGLVILAIAAYHVLTYNQHAETAGIDLAASLAGMAFIAFTGQFLIQLRFMPEGLFWLLQCIVPAGISDVGAFFIGSLFGSHKIAPQLSPNKSWEGYFGGVFTSMLLGYGLGLLLGTYSASFSGVRGLVIGLVVGIISPLGDFTKSIFKRHFGLKNTGNLIPGHGGVLDRIDTWLIAGVVSYFMIHFFFI